MARRAESAGRAPGTPARPVVAVRLLQPVRHDGMPYAAGATLDLPPEQAAALVAAGAAEEARK